MIIDLQRRLMEIGRIRLGQQIKSENGKARPAKLETFRLTSANEACIRQASALYGGTVKPWDAPAGRQWEVITEATALDVIVPPSDMAFSQFYELWSAGGCQRRCDGQSESINDGSCLCDPDNRECQIHSRLSVLLTNLTGLGTWRVETSGYYAAVELQGAVEIIQIAAGRGQMLPARLRLEQRSMKRTGDDGKPLTRRFAVPVLDIEISPGQLIGNGPQRLQITAGSSEPSVPAQGGLLTPVPASLPSRPLGGVAQQVNHVEQGGVDRPQRKNAAQPLSATGLDPRTRAQVADEVLPDAGFSSAEPVTKAQLTALHAAFGELKMTDRDDRLAYASGLIGRDIATSNELTRAEASALIDELKRAALSAAAEDAEQ